MPTRFVVAAVALVALFGLIWATLQFGPEPPPKVDRQTPPAVNPLVAAGGGGTDAPQTADGLVPELSEAMLAWKVNAPFSPDELATDRSVTPPDYRQWAPEHLDEATLDPTARVLGVSWKGESRAYAGQAFIPGGPSVINDVLGGDPIAVSLCPRSGSVVAVLRKAAGIELTFSDSGTAWRGNTVWRDAETGTHWCQLLARGMQGQLIDVELVTIPVMVVSWQEWRARFPQTSLWTATDPGDTTSAPLPPWSDDDQFGIGIRIGEHDQFYSVTELHQIPLRRDELNQAPIVVLFRPGTAVLSAFHRRTRIQDFELDEQGRFVDRIAGTTWDLVRGQAVAGRDIGQQLHPLRYQWCAREGWKSFFHPND